MWKGQNGNGDQIGCYYKKQGKESFFGLRWTPGRQMVSVNILEAKYRLVWNEVEVENEREQWDDNNSYSIA